MIHYIIKKIFKNSSEFREEIIFCSQNKELAETKNIEYNKIIKLNREKLYQKDVLLIKIEKILNSIPRVNLKICDKHSKKCNCKIFNPEKETEYIKLRSDLRRKILLELSDSEKELLKFRGDMFYYLRFEIIEIVNKEPF